MPTDCPHRILKVVSFHSTGAFVSCTQCKGDMYIRTREVETRYPFLYTSPRGADHDIYVLIPRVDV